MPKLDKALAQFFKKRRGEKTFAQFSRLTGLPVSTLFRLENHQQSITLATLESLMNRLKVHWSDIFSDKRPSSTIPPTRSDSPKKNQ